jgi:hypothetical protein
MRSYYPSSFDRINVVTDPDQRIKNVIANTIEDVRFSPGCLTRWVKGIAIQRHDALGFNVTLGDTRYFPNNRADDAGEYILGLIKARHAKEVASPILVADLPRD